MSYSNTKLDFAIYPIHKWIPRWRSIHNSLRRITSLTAYYEAPLWDTIKEHREQTYVCMLCFGKNLWHSSATYHCMLRCLSESDFCNEKFVDLWLSSHHIETFQPRWEQQINRKYYKDQHRKAVLWMSIKMNQNWKKKSDYVSRFEESLEEEEEINKKSFFSVKLWLFMRLRDKG